MKSISKFVGAVAAGLVATCGVAFAVTPNNIPESGSLALVDLVALSRKNRK